MGLTGTPTGNSLMDLWAEMFLLDQGERLGRFIGRYRASYFTPGYISPQGGAIFDYKPREGATEAITAQIADITVSMKAADYLELPEQIETDLWVDLPGKAKTAYREMEKEALLSIDDGDITALNAAAVLTKLTQIANGFIYDEDHTAHRIHDAKAEALAELVEQADGNVLAFYEFRDDVGTIQKRVPECRVLETEKDIDDWNHGRIHVLLAHPASVGYGLNLQGGGHTIVWYGLTWSLEQYLQANARLHRQGQTKPVLVYRLLAKDTVDAQIAESLVRKDATQEAVLNILKRRKESWNDQEKRRGTP